MIDIVSGAGRLVVGASGSPGSLGALRYARDLACRIDVPVVAVQAWVPPGGDLAERRCPSAALRRIWAEAAGKRLKDALLAAWGSVPPNLDLKLLVVRGEPGPSLVGVADSSDDLLVVGAGRRGVMSRMWRAAGAASRAAAAPRIWLAVPPAAAASGVGASPPVVPPPPRPTASRR